MHVQALEDEWGQAAEEAEDDVSGAETADDVLGRIGGDARPPPSAASYAHPSGGAAGGRRAPLVARMSGFTIPYRSPEIAKCADRLYPATSGGVFRAAKRDGAVSAAESDVWAWAMLVLRMFEVGHHEVIMRSS